MKTMFKQLTKLAMLLAITSFVITSCKKNEEPASGPSLTGKSETYTLYEAGDSGASGTIKFEERSDNSTVITIALTGANGDSPAHIHANTAAETGAIVLDLANVDATGASVTEVDKLNDGTAITYDELIQFDGYVNVHKSATELGVLVAQGDIGQNMLTGMTESYDLAEAKVAGISGKVTFKERKNGEALAELKLTGTSAGGDHPAHIHANTVVEGGSILLSLNNVDGATGMSLTNINQLDDGTAVTYSDLVNFNGYVQVHNSETDLGTPIARGDIGQNALTGNKKEYALNEVNMQGVSGTITFAERNNGTTLISIAISGSAVVGEHPAHIHNGSVTNPGGIAISLTKVDANGNSQTQVSKDDNDAAITYTDLIGYNGYAQVHNLDLTPLTNGNIGSNN